MKNFAFIFDQFHSVTFSPFSNLPSNHRENLCDFNLRDHTDVMTHNKYKNKYDFCHPKIDKYLLTLNLLGKVYNWLVDQGNLKTGSLSFGEQPLFMDKYTKIYGLTELLLMNWLDNE